MHSNFGLASVLAVICSLWGSAQLRGQEFAAHEIDDRPDSIINAPDPSDHTGLLGKIYLQQRYVYLGIDDRDIRQFDKSVQGFDTFLNLPVTTIDLPHPIDLDVFFGYANLGFKGSETFGPPVDVHIAVNARAENYVVGTTIYPTLADGFRPFVQVGAEFTRAEANLAIGPDPMNLAAFNEVDNDTNLLLNIGFEADILDVLGYRATLDLETEDRFRDSMLMNDLILWPHERIYIRGGVATSLDGGGLGFTIGGGLAF
jgi:hypothetical protein